MFTGSWRDAGKAPSLALAAGLLIGKDWAGTRPAPTVVAGGFEPRWLSEQFQFSTTVGHAKGGVAGGIPPHKGGPKARPPKGEE